MIWNDEFETLPREALESLQAKRLQQVAERVYATVPFYRQQFDKSGVKPEKIKSLDDLQRLPFTLKQDMRDNYPYGLFAKPLDQIVRIHASSGTTGKPTVVGYTRRDIDNWTELMARSFVAAGATRGDILHNAYGYGLFTGGLGAHYGAERIGASVIPMSGGNTKKQLMIMQDFGSTVLTCTPSYSLYLAEAAAEEGVDIRNFKLRVGILGAEPWSEKLRNEIEAKVGIKAIDIYGLSEILGHLGGSFYPGDHRPDQWRCLAGRRAGRTGHHDDYERGHPDDPLSHPRYYPDYCRTMHLWSYSSALRAHVWAFRRYVDYPWCQCLPLADRKRVDGH
jgi:phenylacetate-CoA ligase